MSELLTGTWAMQPDYFRRLAALTARGIKSEGSTPGRVNQRAKSIAVIPIHGIISQRGHPALGMFGIAQTLLEQLIPSIRALADHPSVETIILDIDSPGGIIGGVPEAAEAIYSLRSKKRIVAVSNTLAASAAYWIGAAASEFYVTLSSETGSIGAFKVHRDISRALDRHGETVTLIHAGKYKVEGNPYEPLDSEAQAFTQQTLDNYYSMFLTDVARFRGNDSIADTDAGQGRVVSAPTAVADGLADGILTLDDLLSGNVTQPRTRASLAMTDSTQGTATQPTEWDALSAEKKAEFNNDVDLYRAYQRAEQSGQARIVKPQRGLYRGQASDVAD